MWLQPSGAVAATRASKRDDFGDTFYFLFHLLPRLALFLESKTYQRQISNRIEKHVLHRHARCFEPCLFESRWRVQTSNHPLFLANRAETSPMAAIHTCVCLGINLRVASRCSVYWSESKLPTAGRSASTKPTTRRDLGGIASAIAAWIGKRTCGLVDTKSRRSRCQHLRTRVVHRIRPYFRLTPGYAGWVWTHSAVRGRISLSERTRRRCMGTSPLLSVYLGWSANHDRSHWDSASASLP